MKKIARGVRGTIWKTISQELCTHILKKKEKKSENPCFVEHTPHATDIAPISQLRALNMPVRIRKHLFFGPVPLLGPLVDSTYFRPQFDSAPNVRASGRHSVNFIAMRSSRDCSGTEPLRTSSLAACEREWPDDGDDAAYLTGFARR